MLDDDPRPDLAEDSAQWRRLLRLAWERDGEEAAGVYGVLLGVRCMGARLESGRIRPPVDMDESEWSADRERYLVPHRAAIVELLAAVAVPTAAVAQEQLAFPATQQR